MVALDDVEFGERRCRFAGGMRLSADGLCCHGMYGPGACCCAFCVCDADCAIIEGQVESGAGVDVGAGQPVNEIALSSSKASLCPYRLLSASLRGRGCATVCMVSYRKRSFGS